MSGLKTGMENGMFWSEIGSEFGEPGGTPPPQIFKEYSPPPPGTSTPVSLVVRLVKWKVYNEYMCHAWVKIDGLKISTPNKELYNVGMFK